MEKDTYDVVILGAGPGGLTAAHSLGKQGARTLVVERSRQVGGLMRGVSRGEFRLDLGRKDLHADRFPDVHALWTSLLGADYVATPRHVGILYGGRILEKSRGPKGPLRGMTAGHALKVAAGALWSQVKPGSRAVKSKADFDVLRYGKAYYDTFVGDFQRKFEGTDPTQVAPLRPMADVPRFAVLRDYLSKKPHGNGARPHHPAFGTQQIVDALYRETQASGVEFAFGAEAVSLNTEGDRLRSVTIRQDGVERTLSAGNAIAGLPAPMILKLLQPAAPEAVRTPPAEERSLRKSTALVYLLANGAPRFPHSWLEVTDPSLNMGRVTSYSAWGGRMVPRGKTALCIEFFAIEGDGLLELSKEALLELAVSEATQTGLIDKGSIYDSLVFQMPLANATTLFTDWRTPWMAQARSYLRGIEGLFETNRPGMDRSCLAGIDAAEACLTARAMSERSLEDTEAVTETLRPARRRVWRFAFGN
jgi:protoporphyrinogen oxidase